jgi:hypothetical protein
MPGSLRNWSTRMSGNSTMCPLKVDILALQDSRKTFWLSQWFVQETDNVYKGRWVLSAAGSAASRNVRVSRDGSWRRSDVSHSTTSPSCCTILQPQGRSEEVNGME